MKIERGGVVPKLGEIQKGREIGKAPSQKYVWHACTYCGRERWVALWRGRPIASHCRSCTKNHLGNRLHRVENHERNGKLRLSRMIATRINRTLMNGKNGPHWETLVGYTIIQLTAHLEKQFTEGMSWENHGIFGWHIDHIIPICAFNFVKPEDPDFKQCWELKNLKPLWAKDNERKGDKIQGIFQRPIVKSPQLRKRKTRHRFELPDGLGSALAFSYEDLLPSA